MQNHCGCVVAAVVALRSKKQLLGDPSLHPWSKEIDCSLFAKSLPSCVFAVPPCTGSVHATGSRTPESRTQLGSLRVQWSDFFAACERSGVEWPRVATGVFDVVRTVPVAAVIAYLGVDRAVPVF